MEIFKKRKFFILLGLILFFSLIFLFHSIFSDISAEVRNWSQIDWRGGESLEVITEDSNTFLDSEGIDYSQDGILTLEQSEDWDLEEWLYRQKITFDNTQENLGIEPEDLVDFPVLVKLEDGVNIDYSKTKSNGEDIRFVDEEGELLSYEIESWDNTDDSFIWVRVPEIAVGDTSYIHMYYGNNNAEENQNAPGVWDENFLGVWHKNDQTSSTIKDSTLNANHGTKKGSNEPIEAGGKFGKAQNYDGVDDHVALSAVYTAGNNFTFSGWLNIPSSPAGDTHADLFRIGTGATQVFYAYTTYGGANGNLRLFWVGSETLVGSDIRGAGWTHIAMSRVGSNFVLYVNGEQDVVGVSSDAGSTASFNLSRNFALNGLLDEIRISNVARSASWIAAEYHAGENAFSVYKEEEPRSASSGYLLSNIFDPGYSSDWDTLTYTSSGSGTVEVRVRTDVNEGMNGASDWIDCTPISSGSLLSSNSCVNDEDRYIQYHITLEPDGAISPEFENISISFSASDQLPPVDNASNVNLSGGLDSGTWLKTGPSIIWDAGVDDPEGGGVEGYCISLDEVGVSEESSLLDPQVTSGKLMGLDDGVNNDGCPYIVTDTSVNLSEISGLTLESNKKYYFSIKAVDFAGNVYTGNSEDYQDLVWFRYDNTAPSNVMYISVPSTNFGNVNDMLFSWPTSGTAGSLDNESGVLGWQYSVNSSSDWKGTEDHPILGIEYIPKLDSDGMLYLDNEIVGGDIVIGNNTIYFRTLDIAGNVSGYVTGGINFSGSAPEFPANSSVTVTPKVNISNDFSFSWPSATLIDAKEISSYYYMINTQPPTNLSTLRSNSHIYIPTQSRNVSKGKVNGAVKGENTIYVVAVDSKNNYSPTRAISGSFTLNSTLPDPPRNVAVADLSIKSTELWRSALTWEEPIYKGNGELSYIIYRSETGNFWQEVASTTGLAYTDIVPYSQTYYYMIGTVDTSNESQSSPSYSHVVELHPQGRYEEPPELLDNPLVHDVTTRSAKITWLTDRVGDSRIQIGMESGNYFPDEVSRSEMVVNHELELTNLLPGTQYYYRVNWTDNDGNTGLSDEFTFKTKPAPIVRDVHVDSLGLDYAIIKLTTIGATKVKIDFGRTESYGGSEEINTSTAMTEYSLMLRDLEDGTQYHYKIVLFDEEGFIYESFEDRIFTTPPRPQVSNIQLQEQTGVPTPTVDVYWESNIPITSIVRYTGDGRTLDQIDMELKQEHHMEISNLEANNPYELVVEGVDSMGNRATSLPYSFTTAIDTRPPDIFNIRSSSDIQSLESQSDRSRSAQLIISWETDEPATSQVLYGEGVGLDGGYSFSTPLDSELRFKHVVVVGNLSPSKVYNFKVLSRDAAGNLGESGSVTAITPKGSDTVLENILNSLSRIFRFL